jgi:hypothetical protein
MGTPIKLTLENQTVFVCCAGCRDGALKKLKETLARVKQLQKLADPSRAESTP